MKEEIGIVDIDDTLTDVPERIHHLQKKPKTWKASEEWAKIGRSDPEIGTRRDSRKERWTVRSVRRAGLILRSSRAVLPGASGY